MAVIKKAQSVSKIAQKKSIKNVSVQSIREPSIIREMGDASFGTLNSTKDGQIVSYDSTTDRFILITADQLLGVSAEDNDISDVFVTTLEQELNLGQLQGDIDGGLF